MVAPAPGKPPRLLDVPTALSSFGAAAVIGVVVDVYGDARWSMAKSCFITFTIKDSDLNNGHTWDGLKIKYFASSEQQLPPVRQGDVILLRNIWIKRMNGSPLGVASQTQVIPWAIFRHNADPTAPAAPVCGPTHFELSTIETRRCRQLLENLAGTSSFRDGAALAIPPASAYRSPSTRTPSTYASPPTHGVQASASKPRPKPGPRKKFSLIENVTPGMYVDLVCEVVKIAPPSSSQCLVYVTDYTTNPGLRNHASGDDDVGTEGDPYNYQSRQKTWPGPKGRMTLPVLLWEPHASYARQLQASDIVHLRNVHMKQDRDNQLLEGVIHTDQAYPDKVTIDLADDDDDHYKELLRRKEEYWKQNPKRKAEEEPRSAPKSKKAKAKQRKQEQPKREEGQRSLVIEKQKQVQAANPALPLSTLEDIINNPSHDNVSPEGIEYRLPFQNLCYRSLVRVVDFFPPRLEDFSVPEESQDNPLSQLPTTTDGFTRWQWRFCLLVESAQPPAPGGQKAQIKLYVNHHNAEYLLSLDPSDLRKNENTLEELREKLYLLWGDLEEKKRKAIEERRQQIGPVSTRPFECCIQEYGVVCYHRASRNDLSTDRSRCSQENCLGWEQRYAMFMTAIKS